MLPSITVFGRPLFTYGLLGVIGFGLGLCVVLGLSKRFSLDLQTSTFLSVFGGLGGMVGAKLLYLITLLPVIIANWGALVANPLAFLQLLFAGGLVFYGGLAGIFGGAFLCARYLAVRLRDYLPALIPALPLFHAFGRIGCFCAGCCHGIEADWGIAFTHAVGAPNGIPFVPVQLFEAAAELIIFALVLGYDLSGRRDPLRLVGLYLGLYAPTRFLLEFWRGDTVRGFWGGLSTSQWLSIAVLILGAVLLWKGTAILPHRISAISHPSIPTQSPSAPAPLELCSKDNDSDLVKA